MRSPVPTRRRWRGPKGLPRRPSSGRPDDVARTTSASLQATGWAGLGENVRMGMRRPDRRAVGIWTLAVLLTAAGVAPLVHHYLVSWPQDQWQVDLEVYREAGRSILFGRPIYDVL